MPADGARTILVGVDGSDPANVALTTAARRARAGDKLVAAHVVAVEPQLLDSPYFDEALKRGRDRGETFLRHARGAVEANTPLTSRLAEGPPASTLVDLAHEVKATEIVVGSRGFGGFRSHALGSTGHALLHESDLPVVVITRRAVEHERRAAQTDGGGDMGAIVVGYDGSDHARGALEYALLRRAASAGRVIAVYAYTPPADLLGWPYYQRALEDHRRRGREVLAELETRTDVETDLLEGPAAEALIRAAAAHDASEIVVGSRGLGQFRAALGSVSHALLHDADRPLVIVP